MSKRIPIILGILLTFLTLWLLISSTSAVQQVLERLEKIGYDVQLRTRALTQPYVVKTPIAIVDIDNRSIQAEGHWPWPREKIATLVDKLKQAKASVIAFDIFFSEPQKNILSEVITSLTKKNDLSETVKNSLEKNKNDFDQDAIFAKSISQIPSVLAIGLLPDKHVQNELPKPLLTLSDKEVRELTILHSYGYISNIPSLQAVAKDGFINIFPDIDGIIRKAPLVMAYQSGVYPSLALQAVLSFLQEQIQLVIKDYNGVDTLEGVQIGARTINTDSKGQVIVPFIGKSYTFPYYSATDILHDKIPSHLLEGNILFVGTSATGLGDLVPTAIENPFPGVEIQASVANGLLLNQFSFQPAWVAGAVLFLSFFIGILVSFIFPYFGPRLLGLTILIFPALILFINNWIWQTTGLILPLLLPVLLVTVIGLINLLYGYFFETRRREKLKQMFGQYVPEKHIDAMLTATDNYALKGEDREMSVLFADIRSFTSISENMTAKELVEMLNTYFTPMTEIIFKHKGTIDKYVGDLIMAFWGAPLLDAAHSSNAIESAIEMQRKLKMLVTENKSWPNIKMGIGVNSGVMSVGDMGSQYRRNYTVLGDAVNLASRVESLSKFYGVDIITTENTINNQNRFIIRELDLVRVKGKEKGIRIYEIIGYLNEMTQELKEELATHQEALKLYFAREWQQARDLFQQLRDKHLETLIYQIYLKRLAEFIKEPPPENWDGIFVHTSK